MVVSLKESKTKKLAQVITNDTSVKILDFLANRDNATETEIANALKAPISTVHYNLQALMDTRMVKWDEFHYSEKGKEVRHYTLANRYIYTHFHGNRDPAAQRYAFLYTCPDPDSLVHGHQHARAGLSGDTLRGAGDIGAEEHGQ